MPLDPDAVGTKGEPIEVAGTSKDCLLYAVGIGAGTDELAFTTENTDGVDQLVFPTFPVVVGWGRGSPMRSIGIVQPGAAGARPTVGHAAPPDPRRGHGHGAERGEGDVRQGQGSRGGHRDVGHDGRRAALHQHRFGLHPRRRWLGWRARPVRPAERAARP